MTLVMIFLILLLAATIGFLIYMDSIETKNKKMYTLRETARNLWTDIFKHFKD